MSPRDLVCAPNGKLSIEQIGQTLGVGVAVWSSVHPLLHGNLDPAILSISLAYLGSVHAYSRWLNSRNGASDEKSQ